MMAKEWRELDWKWEAKYWKERNKGTGLNKEALRESELEKGGGTREKAGSKEKEDEEDIKAREGTRHKGKWWRYSRKINWLQEVKAPVRIRI